MQAYRSGVRGVKEAVSPLFSGNPFGKAADTGAVHAGIKEYLLLLSKATSSRGTPLSCNVQCACSETFL